MKKIFSKRLVSILVGSLLLGLMYTAYSNRYVLRDYLGLKRISKKDINNPTSYCEGCASLFTDGVATQENAYRKKGEGIVPQENYAGLKPLLRKGVLQKIHNGKHYYMAPLHYSYPLMRPKAIAFIKELDRAYAQNCQAARVDCQPFCISSVTRTKETVRALGITNPNSIENSGHLRGKTFDVSYFKFNNHRKALKVFIKTLSSLRNQNRCYVKFERNGCLHITVR